MPEYCGRSECHGHGLYAKCGDIYFGGENFQCNYCKIKELTAIIGALTYCRRDRDCNEVNDGRFCTGCEGKKQLKKLNIHYKG